MKPGGVLHRFLFCCAMEKVFISVSCTELPLVLLSLANYLHSHWLESLESKFSTDVYPVVCKLWNTFYIIYLIISVTCVN